MTESDLRSGTVLWCMNKYCKQRYTENKHQSIQSRHFLFQRKPYITNIYMTLAQKNIIIKQKVAYVHGKAFHVDGGGERNMRLNFSYSTNVEENKQI